MLQCGDGAGVAWVSLPGRGGASRSTSCSPGVLLGAGTPGTVQPGHAHAILASPHPSPLLAGLAPSSPVGCCPPPRPGPQHVQAPGQRVSSDPHGLPGAGRRPSQRSASWLLAHCTAGTSGTQYPQCQRLNPHLGPWNALPHHLAVLAPCPVLLPPTPGRIFRRQAVPGLIGRTLGAAVCPRCSCTLSWAQSQDRLDRGHTCVVG